MCISVRNRPSATGAFLGRAPLKSLLVPPSEDCAPKKVTGSVTLECNSRLGTPKTLVINPEFLSKNCLFADFAIKTLFYCFWSTPQNLWKFARAYFETNAFFSGFHICAYRDEDYFFGLHPKNRGNLPIFQGEDLFLWSLPKKFMGFRAYFVMNTFAFFHTPQIEAIKFLCPPKIVYSHPVMLLWHRA